jgi:uncharacterized protein YndB with AHSA1/START domain
MIATNKTTMEKDIANKRLHVSRTFDAPLEKVWSAWTENKLLDQWWAPKPWKAVTKSMDFTAGGKWLYYMAGPQGEQQWCRVDYKSIDKEKSFSGQDAFCDEGGKINEELPRMQWDVDFKPEADSTMVDIEISFATVEDLETIIRMGFEEGFAMAHENLDEVLARE